ncbi:MAG: YkgJ family cysteine cluster protein [Verrucomicrobia bacterium]|nr:YkgJ family cysteine cluster protein [Verrucomicrobiota bacterium]
MKRHAASLAEVRSVYAELAARPIQRNCLRRTECCQFQRTGKIPQLTRGEALLVAQAFRATGRKFPSLRKDGACPMLQNETGKCLIYESRPFGCRTHFCQAAGGPIGRQEVLPLIRRLEKVDAELGGDGPHPLPQSITQALREL